MKQSCTFVLAGVVLAACLLHCSARQEEAPAPAPAAPELPALANYAFPGHNLRPLKGLPPCFTCLSPLHAFRMLWYSATQMRMVLYTSSDLCLILCRHKLCTDSIGLHKLQPRRCGCAVVSCLWRRALYVCHKFRAYGHALMLPYQRPLHMKC